MRCPWKEFLNILPHWMRFDVDKLGATRLQEIRMRIGHPPELSLGNQYLRLDRCVDKYDLDFVINVSSEYSPWSAATSAYGYITAPGGHRVGMCGEAVIANGNMTGLRNTYSLCLRVARDFPEISRVAANTNGSMLIIGPPGSGKTTFLRDLIREKSAYSQTNISVVDERGELFPISNGSYCFPIGERTDILTNCPKRIGIIPLLRTMNPGCIAVDEITQPEDCEALLQAAWSGVALLATAHASNREDLMKRAVYKPLLQFGLFDKLIVMQPDKSWRMEKI